VYAESELLPLSALQHFSFCMRQCALIHLERQWVENRYTAEGRVLHQRVHEDHRQTRGDRRTITGMALVSYQLGLSGVADVVEYHRQADGTWLPFPVEFKRGRPKKGNHDRLQLCAQAIALEEMHGVPIPAGALFYGKTRRRSEVSFDAEMRAQAQSLSDALHRMFDSGSTPPPEPGPKCESCSFLLHCRPNQLSKLRAKRYVKALFELSEPDPESS